uniref:Wake-up-call, isoform A n=1 Tax=Drosophila melanogaster TaxID=7227 RepID=A1Z949_DROME|nr:Wake-up-call, isoform B [Drosophila melanogaster]NP_610814.1 Wake-up-call, isoform A [Drosophila melanogaster]AAF58467.1 Wake-up-call, isoform A [Drosophila melanogaster]ABV53780.1 Wake-up-call, isoform B [Drosophila melanogaster]|eukprot:NP_001097291.1 Wake-up-call, isoform B [Drosophila melanogaster]
MKKVTKSIKREGSPSDEEYTLEEDPIEFELEKMERGSSNGESEEESQRDQKQADSIIDDMVEQNDQEQEAAGEQDVERENDLRKMYELSLLPPAAIAAQIQQMEKEIYELSQWEARELIRSKHLRIFGNCRRRANK